MKRIYIINIAAVLLLLTACEQERYTAALATADSLITVNADSAKKMLTDIGGDSAKMTKSHQTYYNLLKLKADIMSSVRQSSTATALEIMHYYETGGDRRMLPQAYYCVACAYRDQNDAPQALDYYQKTLDAMLDDGDLQLKSYTNSQIGCLFQRQKLYGNAADYFYRSFQIDSIRKDTSSMIKALINMSLAYENGNMQRCLQCLQKARQLNGKANVDMSNLIDKRLSALFLNSEEYDSALVYIQKPLKHPSKGDSSAVFSIACDIYSHKGIADSAKYFSLELMRMGTVYEKKKAAKVLSRIYFEEHEPKLCLKYIDCYNGYVDSVEKLDAKQALLNANALYNYKIREKEIVQMKMERKTLIVTFLVVFIVGGFVTSLLIFYSFKNKQKQQTLRLRIALMDKLEKESQERNESKISEREHEIESLTQELNTVKNSRAGLAEQLQEQKKRLAFSIENGKKDQLAQDELKQRLLKSEAYSIATKKLKARKPISSSEWSTIMDDLEGMLSNFRVLLYQAYNLSEQEYRICLLIKMGFKNVEIGILVSRGENTISQMRKRLYTKITGKEGTASDFDRFIKAM